MKRLFFVLPTLNIGGIERVSIDLINHLKGFYEVHLVVLNLGINSFEVPDGIFLHNLSIKRARYSYIILRDFFKKHRDNIVVSPVTYITIILSFYKKYIYKLISIEHGLVSCRFQDVKNIFYKALYFSLLKNSLNRIDNFIFVSESVKTDWQTYLKYRFDNCAVIHNLVDFESIDRNKSEKINYGVEEDKFRFLSVGRLSFEKNIELSLSAIISFRNNNDLNFNYIIIGDGPEKPKLNKFIKNNNLSGDVCLYGFDRNPYKYMNHSDIIILTSYHEALPTVIIESLYLGMKVVGTYPIGGVGDIVEGADGVFLTPNYDARDISNNLEFACKYTHDAKKNRLLMVEKFGKNIVLKKYIKIIES